MLIIRILEKEKEEILSYSKIFFILSKILLVLSSHKILDVYK